MSITIAVDIGGTHIRVAAYQGESTAPIAHHRTRSLASEPGVFDRLVQAIEAIWPAEPVSAIGIASPGPLDPYTGTIHPDLRRRCATGWGPLVQTARGEHA